MGRTPVMTKALAPRRRRTDHYSKKKTVVKGASQAGWSLLTIVAAALGSQLANPNTVSYLISEFPTVSVVIAIVVPALGAALVNWAKNCGRD